MIEQASGLAGCRGFRAAIEQSQGLGVISEVKRRSPSKGDLSLGLDPAVLAGAYQQGGATCLSVLTDEAHFGGSAQDLAAARAAVTIPVLRKDFTVCLRDVVDARLMGADAVLLIVAALSDAELQEFHSLALQIGLDVLVETHDESEVQRALEIGATLIGVNQRDLVTFEVDTERAVRVGASIPDGIVRVAESGVRSAEDAQVLYASGYHAVLVGESLVRAGNPAEAVSAMRSVSGD